MRLAPRNRILLGLVAVLLALELALGGFSLGAPGGARDPLLPDLMPGDVHGVRVASGAEVVHLDRSDGGWWVRERGGFPANELLVDALLAPLPRLSRAEPVAREASSHARYGLGPEAVEVSLRGEDGAVLATLRLGRPRDEAGGSYVLVGEAPEVHRAAGLAVPHADPGRWLELHLCDLDLARVRGVEARWRDGRGFHLVQRENGLWDAVGAGGSLPPARVHGLVTLCANLLLEDVVAVDPAAAGLTPPAVELRFDLDRGVRRLALGDELEAGPRGGARAATSADWPEPWVVRVPERSTRRVETLLDEIRAALP